MVGAICDLFTEYCICNGIVNDDSVPWLRYCIEKRLSTLLCGIPFFILAIYLSDIPTAFSIYVGFYQMRKKAGGFHSKTILGCIFTSVAIELLFMGIIFPLLNSFNIYVISVANAIIFFLLAPHNHPNMHLSVEEVFALKKSARMTVSMFTCIVVLSQKISLFFIAKGLTIGSAMAAFTLCLAYINDWRLFHGEHKGKDQHSFAKDCYKDDLS